MGNGTSEYGPRGTRSVPGDAPMGRHEGAELLTAQNTGVPNVTFRSAPWGARRGRLGTLRMEPSVLANTSTDPSQEYTLFFQKRKIRDFAGPVGDTPKVTLRKSCLAPLILEDNKRATTNVQNGLVFLLLFSFIFVKKRLDFARKSWGKVWKKT